MAPPLLLSVFFLVSLLSWSKAMVRMSKEESGQGVRGGDGETAHLYAAVWGGSILTDFLD